jgi:hypothetical protein
VHNMVSVGYEVPLCRGVGCRIRSAVGELLPAARLLVLRLRRDSVRQDSGRNRRKAHRQVRDWHFANVPVAAEGSWNRQRPLSPVAGSTLPSRLSRGRKKGRRGFCRLRHRRLSRLVPEAPCPDDLRVVSLPAATLQLFGKRPAEHVRAWRGLAGGEVDAGNASHRDSGAQDHARPYAGRGDYVRPRLPRMHVTESQDPRSPCCLCVGSTRYGTHSFARFAMPKVKVLNRPNSSASFGQFPVVCSSSNSL